MRWLQHYRLRESVRGSLWLTPLLSMMVAIPLAPVLHDIDERTHWKLLHYGLDGARAIAGAIAASMFSLTVLVFSIILVAVQLSSAQLSPRAIASSAIAPRGSLWVSSSSPMCCPWPFWGGSTVGSPSSLCWLSWFPAWSALGPSCI